jgi:hypothetical protein
MSTEPLDPALRRLVVGDIHGDWRSMLALLRRVGAIDDVGERQPGWWLAQLGDLIHGGRPSIDDARCLAEGLRLFDVILYGNHELPHAHPAARFPHFVGAAPLTPDAQQTLDRAVAAGRFSAATSIDGWLLTHAGLHPRFQDELGTSHDAATAAALLHERFARRVADSAHDPVFDAVGWARGGIDPVGSIFWLDWRDLRRVASANRLHQIVGHTPCEDGPERAGERLWCVDVGAALSGQVCALLREGADGAWQPIVHPDAGSAP